MAARVKPFYVYCIHEGDGYPVYVGKGHGRRAKAQSKRFGRPVYVWRSFVSEQAAFEFERRAIAELIPPLNRAKGGAGGRVRRRVYRKPRWVAEIERIGTRVYAARELLKFDLSAYLRPERIAAIRQVATAA